MIANAAHHRVHALRSGFRPREPRTRVCLPARMRFGTSWTNITILNISSRGLMARADALPSNRSYVEIRRGQNATIVGKVVWHDDRHFGIRTQDRISLSMMADGATPPPDRPHDPSVERRAEPRGPHVDPVEAFERNRRRAALSQFAVLTAGGLALIFVIGSLFLELMGASVGVVATYLG